MFNTKRTHRWKSKIIFFYYIHSKKKNDYLNPDKYLSETTLLYF